MNKWIILCLMCVSAQAQAQHNKLLQVYRTKVKAYNQDIKAAGYAASIQQEKEKSAKADFLPSLSESFGCFSYVLLPRRSRNSCISEAR